MKFENMTPLQRRLHNAAIVLDAEGDEHGFVGLLREAIATEEAQGVEPYRWAYRVNGVHEQFSDVEPPEDAYDKGTLVELFTRPAQPAINKFLAGKLGLMTAERDKMQLELGDLRALRAVRPTNCGSGHCSRVECVMPTDQQKLMSITGTGEPGVSCGDAHEIWAAAQLAPGEGIADGVARVEALLGASRVPMTNAEIARYCYECGSIGQVPESNLDCCPDGSHAKYVHHEIAQQAHAGFHSMLAADHMEDVRAMVPMTAQELDDLLPTNDSMSRKDSQRWIARAVERHHKIGVKP